MVKHSQLCVLCLPKYRFTCVAEKTRKIGGSIQRNKSGITHEPSHHKQNCGFALWCLELVVSLPTRDVRGRSAENLWKNPWKKPAQQSNHRKTVQFTTQSAGAGMHSWNVVNSLRKILGSNRGRFHDPLCFVATTILQRVEDGRSQNTHESIMNVNYHKYLS